MEFYHDYRAILPALVECPQKHLDVCLAYMGHPANRWKHIRTTNLIERSFKEVKRRVKVMEQFPTEESCIRILSPCFKHKTRHGKVVLSGILGITPVDKRYPSF